MAAVSLNAQVAATLNRFPNHSPEIEVRNDSNVKAVAFAVIMATFPNSPPHLAPFAVFVDALVNPDRAGMPLAPRETFAVPVTTGTRAGKSVDLYEPPITVAAIFADGKTSGDPILLSRLVSRRATMLQAVELASRILSDAGAHNMPREQVVGQFQRIADSLNHAYLSPEQQVGRALYQSIAEKLTTLPQQEFGAAFPSAGFVKQEIEALNRQRTELLNSQPALAVPAANSGGK